jgi:hypothetical protein
MGFLGVTTFLGGLADGNSCICVCVVVTRSVRVQPLWARGGLMGNEPARFGGLLGGLSSTLRDA